jgi:hypothetical protein
MGSLRVTNFLLALIALCLIYQCTKKDEVPVVAAARPQPASVRVVNFPSVQPVSVTNCVDVSGTVEATITNPGPLRVHVANDDLSVSIKGVKDALGYDTEALPVKLLNHVQLDTTQPLPVSIEGIKKDWKNSGFHEDGYLPVSLESLNRDWTDIGAPQFCGVPVCIQRSRP